jgi:hypothetical protein
MAGDGLEIRLLKRPFTGGYRRQTAENVAFFCESASVYHDLASVATGLKQRTIDRPK